MADDSYEAMVFSAHLPSRTITFVYQDGGPPFAAGIFRIARVRTATAEDREAFKLPRDGRCCVCGRRES